MNLKRCHSVTAASLNTCAGTFRITSPDTKPPRCERQRNEAKQNASCRLRSQTRGSPQGEHSPQAVPLASCPRLPATIKLTIAMTLPAPHGFCRSVAMAPDRPLVGNGDPDTAETKEWLDSLGAVLQTEGPARASYLLTQLKHKAVRSGVEIPFTANTPYINTIPPERQPPFPGSREVERRIKSLVRWNAMAMVVRANKHQPGIGGHISTYASAATLLEVGYNHFFRGPDAPGGGDQIYFQGHASPGIYARAFLEGRLPAAKLENFRRELAQGGGLSSYPHPWLMPDFWQFPTVSMGLGPIMAIYQARFNRYVHQRGLKDTAQQHVWCFVGDGESDEPETLGAMTLASREKLDNLIFVVNCNLQRLDGPVRGNGKIIQELEAAFRGAGWNVIKLIWGGDWDDLFAHDER